MKLPDSVARRFVRFNLASREPLMNTDRVKQPIVYLWFFGPFEERWEVVYWEKISDKIDLGDHITIPISEHEAATLLVGEDSTDQEMFLMEINLTFASWYDYD